jgi:hypothetical protein
LEVLTSFVSYSYVGRLAGQRPLLTPILQIRKLSCKKIEGLAQGNMVSNSYGIIHFSEISVLTLSQTPRLQAQILLILKWGIPDKSIIKGTIF